MQLVCWADGCQHLPNPSTRQKSEGRVFVYSRSTPGKHPNAKSLIVVEFPVLMEECVQHCAPSGESLHSLLMFSMCTCMNTQTAQRMPRGFHACSTSAHLRESVPQLPWMSSIHDSKKFFLPRSAIVCYGPWHCAVTRERGAKQRSMDYCVHVLQRVVA
jgi:hypothetical protein